MTCPFLKNKRCSASRGRVSSMSDYCENDDKWKGKLEGYGRCSYYDEKVKRIEKKLGVLKDLAKEKIKARSIST